MTNPLLVRSKELHNVLGISKATIYRLAKEYNDFPKPLKLSDKNILWDVGAIKEFLVKRFQVEKIEDVVIPLNEKVE